LGLENSWKKNLAILWVLQFIGMSAITGVISFLPLYVPHLGVVNVSTAAMWSGILMGATSFFAALSNPFWGAMADRNGRKPMVERVLLLFGLIMILMAFASNIYQLLFLRIFQGLCGGFTAAATALAISMSPKKEISFTVGMLQTALIVGGASGPMIGGLIADHFGYRQPFVVFGVLCLIALVVVHFRIQEIFTPVVRSEKSPIKAVFKYVWSIGDLKLMLLVQFLTQFAMQSIGPILPMYILSLGAGSSNIASISGTIIAIAGLTSAMSSASMGFLSRHFSHKQILITSAFLGGLSFIGQIAATDVISLGILRALNGLCIGAMVPSSNTIVTYLIPEDKRGAAFGITGGASLLGNVLGPTLAGVVTMAFGITSIFWLTAVFFLFVGTLLLLQIKQNYTAYEEGKPAVAH
jgi:MFS transporter, DHA1 family, multidrug resistance protein